VTLTVARLGHLGDGIADGPDGPVYIPLTLPGEVVTGRIQGDRIAAPDIVAPAPDRVQPPCPHFARCGGCALQHAADRFVARWKIETLRRALAARGLPAPIRRIAVSPPGSRRRAGLAGRRVKSGALVGFHARASDTLIEVPDCRVLHPEIVALMPALTDLTRAVASRKGTLGLAVTWSGAGADLAVTGGRGLDPGLRQDLTGFAETADLARLSWAGEIVVERRPPLQRFDGIAVVPPPGAFLQATRAGEAALIRAVAEAVGPAKRVVDLFAGSGTFALPLAQRAEVHAVEGDAAMRAALFLAWRRAAGLKRLSAEVRDLFRDPVPADTLAAYEAAVIDPPRAGAEAQTRALAQARVPRIAAVSCNPVSFSRDAQILVDAGYRLDWIDVVDQFRWSPHIELAARLTADHIANDRT